VLSAAVLPGVAAPGVPRTEWLGIVGVILGVPSGAVLVARVPVPGVVPMAEDDVAPVVPVVPRVALVGAVVPVVPVVPALAPAEVPAAELEEPEVPAPLEPAPELPPAEPPPAPPDCAEREARQALA
jgi:hypothetical protein